MWQAKRGKQAVRDEVSLLRGGGQGRGDRLPLLWTEPFPCEGERAAQRRSVFARKQGTGSHRLPRRPADQRMVLRRQVSPRGTKPEAGHAGGRFARPGFVRERHALPARHEAPRRVGDPQPHRSRGQHREPQQGSRDLPGDRNRSLDTHTQLVPRPPALRVLGQPCRDTGRGSTPFWACSWVPSR